jgi:uncharacterized protein (DUF302 family)
MASIDVAEQTRDASQCTQMLAQGAIDPEATRYFTRSSARAILGSEAGARGAGSKTREPSMFRTFAKISRPAALAVLLVLSACATPGGTVVRPAAYADAGVVKVQSAYGMDETIARIKADIADKGIMFFDANDQQQLAADADIKLGPSTLLVFGNPALGSQFITSNPIAGLDWPVRLLITEDDSGQVWAAYTDFDTIARRHHIADRDDAFKMASQVVASITASVAAK